MELNFSGLPHNKAGKPRKLYLVCDTETATLPFADTIAENAREKKVIAIQKPLVYDIAWHIIDRKGNLYASHSFLVAETFAVPSVFNTAYYKDKRPIYIERLENGETCVMPWHEIMKVFVKDLAVVQYVAAYNSMFDYKKAIPFTELYIKRLYSNNYYEWEETQKKLCLALIGKGNKPDDGQWEKAKFDQMNFKFRGVEYPMLDLWGISCSKLINNSAYKRECVRREMLTESGLYFKTSAESTYRYINKAYDFNEAHTAIDDAAIECELLVKALSRGKVPEGIMYFPFNELGETGDFLDGFKHAKPADYVSVIIKIETQLERNKFVYGARYFSKVETIVRQIEGQGYSRFGTEFDNLLSLARYNMLEHLM